MSAPRTDGAYSGRWCRGVYVPKKERLEAHRQAMLERRDAKIRLARVAAARKRWDTHIGGDVQIQNDAAK